MLGPLVVGCAAIRTPGDHLGEIPNIWKRIPRHVGVKRSPTGRKIHVNDSKAVYSPAIGIKELERAVLCFIHASPDVFEVPPAISMDDILAALAPDVLADVAQCAWYLPQPQESFPLDNDPLSLRLFANAMRQEMASAQTTLTMLRARVVLEEPLNRLMDATRNKSNASFSFVAWHIDRLLRAYAAEGLVIFCDRQGGRCYYGSLLRLMFEDWSLQIVREEESICEYRISRGDQTVPITFAEKAESRAMSVALASMISKYLRECLMSRFNAWWTSHIPELRPTAGYHNDGVRFLQDIATKRQELGIPDARLIRSR